MRRRRRVEFAAAEASSIASFTQNRVNLGIILNLGVGAQAFVFSFARVVGKDCYEYAIARESRRCLQ